MVERAEERIRIVVAISQVERKAAVLSRVRLVRPILLLYS